MSSLPAAEVRNAAHSARPQQTRDRANILIVIPTLDSGAADSGAVELTRILAGGGYHPIVASQAGRLVADVATAGGEFVALDAASKNPVTALRNAFALARIARERQCAAIHALGRASAWSAYIAARLTRTPFLTSWFKGFREQNSLKRHYNRIMVRGDHVVAVSEQIAQLINDRYATPWDKISVIPTSIDLDRFDPRRVSRERIDAKRRQWDVEHDTRIVLVTGRMARRKGHHTVVRAAQRLKQQGLKNFLVVFVGEDRGRSGYTGDLWDLVIETGTVDVIRMAAPVNDMPAAYAAASVVVSAARQPEGLQRALVEAQAMEKPVIVSDLGAGPDVVLSPPAVPDDRITGLRFPADDDGALATALLRLFAMPEPIRRAIGARGRKWALDHFNPAVVAEQTLRLYARLARPKARQN